LENNDLGAASRFEALGIEPICVEHQQPLHHPRTVLRVARILRQKDADVAHLLLPTATFIGAFAGQLARTPAVTTVVSTLSPEGVGRVPVRVRFREAVPSLLGVRNSSVSRAAAAEARARGMSIHAVTYPGIADVARQPSRSRAEIRSSIGAARARPLILSVGRLVQGKGHGTLIEALPRVQRRFPEAMLAIAGTGPYEDALKRIATDLGIASSVRLLGLRTDVEDLLYSSDVYDSASGAEGLVGYATLEAALAARPIVAADIPSVTEILEDGVHALLATPGDASGFASTIIRLADDGALGPRLGAAAREVVLEKCSLEAAGRQLEAFYASAV